MDRKECYKFCMRSEQAGAPRPLYLGYMDVEPPFDSFDYKPPKSYWIFDSTLSGCGLFDDGGKTRRLEPGSIFLYKFPSRTRRFYMTPGMDRWLSVYFEFDAGALDGSLSALVEERGGRYELAAGAEITRRLLALRKSWLFTRRESSRGEKVQAFSGDIGLSGLEGAQLVYRLLAEIKPPESSSSARSNLVNAVCEYVNANLGGPLDVGLVAASLSVSRSHLVRVFTERAGCSPHQYIAKAKIRLACKLLSEGALSNKEIADKIGLASEFYFYRMFKQAAGMTPRQFKLSERQEEIVREL